MSEQESATARPERPQTIAARQRTDKLREQINEVFFANEMCGIEEEPILCGELILNIERHFERLAHLGIRDPLGIRERIHKHPTELP
jgi:hypothetical protein